MKYIYTLLFAISLSTIGVSQQITFLTSLQNVLDESSGLIYLNNNLITHNDSGGEPVLYELDSVTGNVTRSVFVSNATNFDWEDLCFDDLYIYIADIGNNNGTRTNLKIYRILISDYFDTPNDTVTAQIIYFSYSDQTDFSYNHFATNYDAEALISYHDSLYIFTKNWLNNRTNVYSLSKNPGNYQIHKISSINSYGLVTGAAFNSLTSTIVLSGYTISSPFVVEISDFDINDLSTAVVDRYLLQIPSGVSIQIESITPLNYNQYYLTAEEGSEGSSGLFRLQSSSSYGLGVVEKRICNVFPNPASEVINVKCDNFFSVEIYDFKAALVKISTDKQIDISDFCRGVYLIIVKNQKGEKVFVEKILIK